MGTPKYVQDKSKESKLSEVKDVLQLRFLGYYYVLINKRRRHYAAFYKINDPVSLARSVWPVSLQAV